MMARHFGMVPRPLGIFLCLCASFIFFSCPCSAQYGFGVLPDSFYSTSQFGPGAVPNAYDTFVNATQADQNEAAFAAPFIEPSTVYIREDLWSSGAVQGNTYERYDMFGVGSFWQIATGQPSVYVDLRQIPNVSPTMAQLNGMGVKFENNGTVTFSLTYYSEINDLEVVHAHGILGGWWTDGVPYLNTHVIARDESQTLAYNIDPNTNSGTYFLHSHYGFNALHGAAAPLVIQYNVSSAHPYSNILNDPNTQEIMFYAEDWCLQFTNADDALHSDGDSTNYGLSVDRSLCQNPYLSMRGVYGEWNSNKGPYYLGNTFTNTPPAGQGALHTCQNVTIAPEFGSAFFLVNDRSYNDAFEQYVAPSSYARLRVINAARMSNFLLQVPQQLQPVVIAVDGSYVAPVNMSSLPTAYQMWVGIAQRVDVLLTIPPTPGVWNIVALQEMPDPATSSSPAFAVFEVSLAAGITLYSTPAPPANTGIPANANGTGMLSVYPDRIVAQEKMFSPWPSSASLDISHAKQVQLALTGYNGIFGMNFNRGLEFPPMRTMEQFISLYASLPPLITVHQGDTVCINMTNYNWDTHPMHLHGHKFQVREINGVSFPGAIRDTVLVPAGNCNSVNICFKAAQPAGSFGFHCHMVIHEMAGMFSVIQYDNGVGLQGVTSNVNPPSTCPSTDDTSTKEKIGLSVGLVLGVLLLVSVGANAFFLLQRSKSSNHPVSDHLPMANRDSLSLNTH